MRFKYKLLGNQKNLELLYLENVELAIKVIPGEAGFRTDFFQN